MTTENKNNKRSLILMIAVFVLPVVLAYMALKFNWFNEASTNRGELMQPVIEASSLIGEAQEKWHLVYVLPANCDTSCNNAILSVRQTYTATGKEADRVSMLFIATENSSKDALTKVSAIGDRYLLQKSLESVKEMFKNTDINAIFISDTQHNIVLTYPVTPDEQQAIMDSRDILADLKKLLKLSRIG